MSRKIMALTQVQGICIISGYDSVKATIHDHTIIRQSHTSGIILEILILPTLGSLVHSLFDAITLALCVIIY